MRFFSFNLVLNFTCEFYKKLNYTRARAISWKTHSCKLILNWTRNRIITYSKSVWTAQLCYFYLTWKSDSAKLSYILPVQLKATEVTLNRWYWLLLKAIGKKYPCHFKVPALSGFSVYTRSYSIQKATPYNI